MLFHNRYRIESSRLTGWDYSSPGYYFITSCTRNRVHFFGEIVGKEMHLNHSGKIVYDEWYRTGEIRDNIMLDEFTVMPNHFHGIIRISVETPRHGVSTIVKMVNWKPGVLGAIVGQFKIRITKRIRKSGMIDFNWQPRFHDHIIRDEKELFLIRQYIRNNPANWEIDVNHTINKSPGRRSPWYVRMP